MKILLDKKELYDHGRQGNEPTIIGPDDNDTVHSISADDEAISDSLRALVMETESILEAIVKLNSTFLPVKEYSQHVQFDTYDDDFSVQEDVCLDNDHFESTCMKTDLPRVSPSEANESISHDIQTRSMYLIDTIDLCSYRSLWLSSHSDLSAATDETICFDVQEVICLQDKELWERNPRILESATHSISTVTAEETICFYEESPRSRREKALERGHGHATFAGSALFPTFDTKQTRRSTTQEIICLYDENDTFEGGLESYRINKNGKECFHAQEILCLHDKEFIGRDTSVKPLSKSPWTTATMKLQPHYVGKNTPWRIDKDDKTRQSEASVSFISELTEESCHFNVDEVVYSHNKNYQKRFRNKAPASISTAATNETDQSNSRNFTDEYNNPKRNPKNEEIASTSGKVRNTMNSELIHPTQSHCILETEESICSNKQLETSIQKDIEHIPMLQSLSTATTEDSICSSTGTLYKSASYDTGMNSNNSKPVMSSSRYLQLATERRKRSSRRVPLTRSVSSGTASTFSAKALSRLSDRGRVSYRSERSTTSDPCTNNGTRREKKGPQAKPPKPIAGQSVKGNKHSLPVVKSVEKPNANPEDKISGRKQSKVLRQEETILDRLCRPTAAWKSRCASKNSFFGNQ